MSISAVVLRAMKQSGVTQRELAGSIGVTQSYISQICSGRKIPTLGTLARIGDYLGIPLEYFVMEDGGSEEEGMLSLSAEERHILRLYRQMSEQDRRLIHAMVDQIADSAG